MTSPRYLELQGTPKQMGEQHGEALQSAIATLASERLDLIKSVSASVDVDSIEAVAVEVLEQTRRLLPDIYEESKATSRAAKVPHWLLLVAGGFSDIIDKVSKRAGVINSLSECTLWPSYGENGLIRLVGTWDTHASAQEALVLIRRRPRHGVETLALSTAGWPMQQGISSDGLAFAIANLVAKTSSEGTSYICALPELVRAATAADAFSKISSLSLCSGRYFVFCDSAGGFEAVETDGSRYWHTHEHLAHTNHYVLEHAKEIEGRPLIIESSERRRRIATTYLKKPNLCTDALFEAIGYNDESHHSIAQYGKGRADRTCAAFVLEPAERRMWFTMGPPGNEPIQMANL
jgi:hypothetical protein